MALKNKKTNSCYNQQIYQEEQRKAATDPQNNVYVSASAGSGKTTLLIKRIIRLMLHGDPGNILCITYTNSAAEEVKERLLNILEKWSKFDDNTLSVELKDLGEKVNMPLLNRAKRLLIIFFHSQPRIQTLHSFCLSLLQKKGDGVEKILADEEAEKIFAGVFRKCCENFSLPLNDSPYFEIQSQSQNDSSHWCNIHQTLGKKEKNYSFRQSLNERREKYTAAIQHLLSRYSENTIINELYNLRHKMFFEERPEDINNSGGVQDIISEIFCNGGEINNAVNVKNSGLISDNFEKKGESAFFYEYFLQKNSIDIENSNEILLNKLHEISQIPHFSHDESWQHIAYALQRQDVEGALSEAYKTFFTLEGNPRSRLPGGSVFLRNSPSVADTLKDIQIKIGEWKKKKDIAEKMALEEAINIVAEVVIRQFIKYKKRKRWCEYYDIINSAIDLIGCREYGPSVLYDVEYRIDHILVDEAQDISREQWRVIMMLSDEFFAGQGRKDLKCTIFFVGDYKQSIFSFQGADPDTLPLVAKYFGNKIKANPHASWVEIELLTNFRSDKAIIDKVNEAFPEWNNHRGQSSDCGIFMKIKDNSPAELVQLIKNLKGSSLELISEYDKKSDIKELKNTGGENKQINWGDIMILVRRNNSYRENLLKELDKHGISHNAYDFINRDLTECEVIGSADINICDVENGAGGDIYPTDLGSGIVMKCERGIDNLKNDNILKGGKKSCGEEVRDENRVLGGEINHSNSIDVWSYIIDHLLIIGKFVLCPDDDLNLFILLKSSFFDFSEEYLMELSPHYNNSSEQGFFDEVLVSTLPYSCLKNEEKVSLWINIKMKNASLRYELEKFISAYLGSTNATQFYLNCRPYISGIIGEEKLRTWLAVLNHYYSFVSKGKENESLEDFIRWAEDYRDEINKISRKKKNIDKNKQNSVVVSTIHSAKGMESPVVIVSDIFVKYRSPPRLFDIMEEMSGGDIFNVFGGYSRGRIVVIDDALHPDFIKWRKDKEMAEDKRLLYVAMTRAMNQLYFFADEGGGFMV